MPPYTLDTFFDEGFLIYQPARGYRFSVDPLLLAAHISWPFPSHSTSRIRILDAGCGCGIISLLMGRQDPHVKIFGVEIQEELALFARENAKINGMDKRFRLLNKDIADLSREDLGGIVDMVVSNPPYKKKGTGRISGNRQKALARHEITMDIHLLCRKASELTGERGVLALIFPAERLDELKKVMRENGFSLRAIRFVYTESPAGTCQPKLVLVSGIQSSVKPFVTFPALYLYDESGSRSREYEDILSSGRAWYFI